MVRPKKVPFDLTGVGYPMTQLLRNPRKLARTASYTWSPHR
jgi:hypothetical protein